VARDVIGVGECAQCDGRLPRVLPGAGRLPALGVGDHRRPAPARGESSGQWCGPHTWVVGHGRWGARLAAALGASV